MKPSTTNLLLGSIAFASKLALLGLAVVAVQSPSLFGQDSRNTTKSLAPEETIYSGPKREKPRKALKYSAFFLLSKIKSLISSHRPKKNPFC